LVRYKVVRTNDNANKKRRCAPALHTYRRIARRRLQELPFCAAGVGSRGSERRTRLRCLLYTQHVPTVYPACACSEGFQTDWSERRHCSTQRILLFSPYATYGQPTQGRAGVQSDALRSIQTNRECGRCGRDTTRGRDITQMVPSLQCARFLCAAARGRGQAAERREGVRPALETFHCGRSASAVGLYRSCTSSTTVTCENHSIDT
jgi:hypothetical protein